ncbi:MBL fold metallo-hydrolase [Halomicrococcus gelatinilyticus]|uniref:MBL fold metallo-hydrolase n=1 Tax=Halomicrococcus gelatinilyticus TaxID=1702103 RepID=UPI002E15EE7A
MATELAAGVWWLDLGNVNCYLADDDDTLTLVDAGTPFDRRDVTTGVRDAGYGVSDIERVLVTHYDFDHVGALARLPDLDATVHVGDPDAAFLTGERRPDWHNHKGALQRATGPLLSTPDLPVEVVADGDEVGSFTAYHAPGHTPGHVVYVSEALDVAFLGDLVRERDGELAASPWVVSYDTDAVTESVRSLADRLPAFSVAAMGHGVPFVRDGSERLADLAARL